MRGAKIKSKCVPALSEEEMDSFYAELNNCKFKPLVLSLATPFADSFVKCFMFINKEYPGYMPPQTSSVPVTVVGKGAERSSVHFVKKTVTLITMS